MFENGTIGLYAKAIASAFAAAAVTALQGMSNGDLSTGQWITVFVTFVAGLVAVAAVPNFPEGARKVLKAIIGAVVAGAGVLAVAIVPGAPFALTVPPSTQDCAGSPWYVRYRVLSPERRRV